MASNICLFLIIAFGNTALMSFNNSMLPGAPLKDLKDVFGNVRIRDTIEF